MHKGHRLSRTVSRVCVKWNLEVMNSGIALKRFLTKVLTAWFCSSFIIIVKYRRKERLRDEMSNNKITGFDNGNVLDYSDFKRDEKATFPVRKPCCGEAKDVVAVINFLLVPQTKLK